MTSSISAPHTHRSFWQRGQGMAEFALVMPLLMMTIIGVMEISRLLVIASGLSGAAARAARYGAVGGESEAGVTFYLDCAGMRAMARRSAFLQNLSDANIAVRYDSGTITNTIGMCDSNNVPRFASNNSMMTSTNSRESVNGGRVVVEIQATYRPLVSLVPIPDIPMQFTSARTLFTSISGPTMTPRFTSTPTASATATQTPSPTPTETATPVPTSTIAVESAVTATPTPTHTATPWCQAGVVSAAHSMVNAFPSAVQADGTEVVNVQVTLFDDCGTLLAGQPVGILSSRGAADSFSSTFGTTNMNGQWTFQAHATQGAVYDTVLGTYAASTFTVTSGFTTLTQTASARFMCVAGYAVPFSTGQDQQYQFVNPTGIDRRLTRISLTWPASGSRKLTTVSLAGNSLWTAAGPDGKNSPLDILNGWSAASRNLAAGAAATTLRLNFNYALSGTGSYVLTTEWDNGAGGSSCTAPAITVTR